MRRARIQFARARAGRGPVLGGQIGKLVSIGYRAGLPLSLGVSFPARVSLRVFLDVIQKGRRKSECLTYGQPISGSQAGMPAPNRANVLHA